MGEAAARGPVVLPRRQVSAVFTAIRLGLLLAALDQAIVAVRLTPAGRGRLDRIQTAWKQRLDARRDASRRRYAEAVTDWNVSS